MILAFHDAITHISQYIHHTVQLADGIDYNDTISYCPSYGLNADDLDYYCDIIITSITSYIPYA